MINLGHNLKELRTQKRLSQVQLSIRSGVTRVVIGKIEKDITNPKMQTIQSLAKALGVPTELLTGPKISDQGFQEISQPKPIVKESEAIEEMIKDLRTEMIKGFARLELLIQMKK